jgi:hypothetical protein
MLRSAMVSSSEAIAERAAVMMLRLSLAAFCGWLCGVLRRWLRILRLST